VIARLLLLALLAVSWPASVEAFSNGELSIETDSKTLQFQIEIADEADERSRGLMFRESLADDEGMLFIYPSPRIASFWMKNTQIPLDMLFIDEDGHILSIARETTPFSLKPVLSGGLVTSVLEISGGLAATLGIDVGDRVEWTEIEDQK
jgi:uncharacterized membrane protein (UPF0127 family)